MARGKTSSVDAPELVGGSKSDLLANRLTSWQIKT